jgi:hypothetical protein
MATINWNNVLPQESGKVAASIGAVLVVLVGAGWGLFSFGYTRGKDIGQDELAAYKAVNEAKLPDLTAGLLVVSKELRDGLKVFDRNKLLEAENSAFEKRMTEVQQERGLLETKNEKLSAELNQAAAREKELTDKIGNLMGNNRKLIVTSGDPAQLLDEGRMFAVEAIFASSVKISYDNNPREISVGGYLPIEFADKSCRLYLLQTKTSPYPYSAEFSWVCKTK